jgi:hypothetical protein
VLEQIGLTGQRIAHEVLGLVTAVDGRRSVNGSAPRVTTR